MIRIYRCDNCGEIISAEIDMALIRFCYFEDGEEKGTHDIAELCEECSDKLEKLIKEGFS